MTAVKKLKRLRSKRERDSTAKYALELDRWRCRVMQLKPWENPPPRPLMYGDVNKSRIVAESRLKGRKRKRTKVKSAKRKWPMPEPWGDK